MPTIIDVLGHCRALYKFTPNYANMEQSEIPIDEGEELFVIEANCEGWTKVRRVYPNPKYDMILNEGFVPSTYLDLADQELI